MRSVERALLPARAVVHAARRKATYSGHLRELTSTVVTMGMWPTGFRDDGLSELGNRAAHSPVATPVLLIHGYGANKSNWLFITRYLNQAGFERVHALNYNPFTADIPALAQQCVDRAEELKAHFGVDRIHVIGHSLGGIIARYAVQVLGLTGVDVLATIASPHGGAHLARFGSPLAVLTPMATCLQLRPDSPVMTLLRTSAAPLPTRFVAYYSNLDLIVPARRAMIIEPELRASNILVKDHGHLSIMLSHRLSASIVDKLGAAEGITGYGTPIRVLASTNNPARPARKTRARRATTSPVSA